MFSGLPGRRIPTYVEAEQAESLGCEGCRKGHALDFDFSMAFQPLVNLEEKSIYGYEALVRGLNDEPAFSIINRVDNHNIYRFDQTCRVKAIALAAEKGLTKRLSINFMPGAVYQPDICIKTTLAAAEKYGFPVDKITFEVVETDLIQDTAHLKKIIEYYKKVGFSTALDDFGSGFANLNWLADLSPDQLKLDMTLIRDIHKDRRRRVIVQSVARLAEELGINLIAEGIEVKEERDCLADIGIVRQQGYFFSKPVFEQFCKVDPACFES